MKEGGKWRGCIVRRNATVLTCDGAVKTPGNHGEEPEEVSNEVLVVAHTCNENKSPRHVTVCCFK